MKKQQVILWLAIIFCLCLVAFGIKNYLDLTSYRQQVAAIDIADVDLTTVPDGTYVGNYEVLWVAAEVKVTVKDHKITGIKLVKHKNGRGAPAEVIPGKVVAAQTLQVDVVSGCTSSSKVILKAIENALQSALKNVTR